jgi:hypothetical protein
MSNLTREFGSTDKEPLKFYKLSTRYVQQKETRNDKCGTRNKEFIIPHSAFIVSITRCLNFSLYIFYVAADCEIVSDFETCWTTSAVCLREA